MARRPRTYEWRDGAVECVKVRGGGVPKYAAKPEQQKHRKQAKMGIQQWLALFTFSSVLMVFAGFGLFAFCFALFAIVFG